MATVLLVAAVAFRSATIAWTGFLYDDAFITFQYAHNLATGKGMVYQTGERVLGTTSPLYAMVLALFEAMRIPSPVAVPWINVVLDIAGLWLMVRWAQRQTNRPEVFRAIFMGGWALEMFSPIGVEAGNGGMESALLRFLLIIFWLGLQRKVIPGVFTLSFLISATRPEGVLYAALIFALNALVTAMKEKRVDILETVTLLVAVLAGASAEWATVGLFYGSSFPASMGAKLGYASLLLRSVQTPFTAHDVPIRLLGTTSGIFVSILYIYGLLWLWREGAVLLPLMAVPLFYYPALAMVDIIAHPWYLLPPLAFLYTGAMAGIAHLLTWQGRASGVTFTVFSAVLYSFLEGFVEGAYPGVAWAFSVLSVFNALSFLAIGLVIGMVVKNARFWRFAGAAIATTALIWVMVGYWRGRPIAGMKEYSVAYRETNRTLAQWVAENFPGATLAVGEIGYAGYALNLRILDLVGLIQPEVARYRMAAAKAHPEEAGLPEVIARYHPDFVALETYLLESAPLARNPYFVGTYTRFREFKSSTGRAITLFKRQTRSRS